MTYGYARISTPAQSIDRQERNIKAEYPDAHIVKEAYTGKTMNRPEWVKLMKHIKSGDTIVFDSVSRMARDADEGIDAYMDLMGKGVSLVFLEEDQTHALAHEVHGQGRESGLPQGTGCQHRDLPVRPAGCRPDDRNRC